jgi:HlyD family secretion protein
MNTMPLATTLRLPTGALATHDPRREIRAGAAVIGLFFVGFLGWSAIAHLDAAVHSSGLVRVAGNRQEVQTASGGVISAIHVVEGQKVRSGDVLVEFATTGTLAQERSLAAHVFALQAEIARIDAERTGAAQITRPAEWATLSPDDRTQADRALAGEQAELDAQGRLATSRNAVLRQRIAETGQQIEGNRKRQESNRRQGELNQDELDSTRKLYAEGYAPKTRLLALERSDAAIDGEIGATTAEVGRLQSQAGETRMQMMQLADQRQQENGARFHAAETELTAALAQWKAAREQLARTQLRAPVSGTVLGLAVHTLGGVAAAGQQLMQIVPSNGELVVDTRIALDDANDLRPGQAATILVQGLRGRSLMPMHGRVSRVSDDTLADGRNGRPYYTATVTVPQYELARISREAGLNGRVRAGTPVEVTVPLRSRTALMYWLEPLFARFSSSALSEG